MRTRFAIVLVAALVVGGVATADPVPVINPGFELDADEDGVPDGWRAFTHGEGFDLGITGEISFEGQRAARLTGLPDHGDRSCFGQTTAPIVVSPGYRLTFAIRGEGSARVTFRFRCVSAAGENIEDTHGVLIEDLSADEWREQEMEFGPSEEALAATGHRIELLLYQMGEGDLYFDDIAIESLAEWTRPAVPETLTPAAPAAHVPTAEVMFVNPGFELDADEDDLPDGWGKAMHGENFFFGLDEDVVHSGERAMRITGLLDHGDRACVLQTSKPLVPSVAYRLHVFVRGEGRATGLFRFHYTPDGGEAEYVTHHFDISDISADEWREFTIEFGSPEAMREVGAGKVEVILYQKSAGDLYYDDVSVEPLATWEPKMTEGQQATATQRAPVDGRRVLQNPPGLTWPGEQLARTYDLQLARDEAFEEGLIAIAALPYNCLQYSDTLVPGTWRWRYRYSDAEGNSSDWSEVWRFDVPDDAAAFTVLMPDDLLALIPSSHPRVYTSAATLDDFRNLRGDRETDAWWQNWPQHMANRLATDIPVEPGPEFDFSKREGALTADSMGKMNELRSLGGRASGPMWELAFGYLVTGNEEWGAGAVARLVEISTWDPEGTTGYRNHDQVFRDIAWKSACAYDWVYDLMTEDQRALVRDAVVARGAILYRDFAEDARPIYEAPFDSHGWTSMGLLGVIAIALAHDDPAADEWFKFTSAVYPVLYPPWGGEEGGWCQGPSYWKYSISYGAIYIDALLSATGVNMYDKAFCRNDGWYKLYMHPPWCDRSHFGDENISGPGRSDRMNMLMYATQYDDPYFKWYADQIPGSMDKGVFGYWRYDESLSARPPADIPQSRYFADIGWVGMHSDLSDPDDIMLMFKSSWFGSFNHSHADQNSFVVYGHGEPLLIDSGYYDWYGAPHDRSWTRETKAHNSILVDGAGQPVFDITAKGEITDYFEAPPGCYTVGDASAAYGGKLSKFVRHVLYLRPDVFLIVDELEAEEPRTWTWTCHSLEEMEIDQDARRIRVKQGDATLDLAFAAPENLTIRQDNDFGVRPQGRYANKPDQWHCYAETTEPSTTQRFVTLMRVGEGGEAPEFGADPILSGEGIEASLAGLGGPTVIVRTSGTDPIELQEATFDGEMLLGAMHEPTNSWWLAVDARSLRLGEWTLFESTQPLNIAMRWGAPIFPWDAHIRTAEPTQVKLGGVPPGMLLNGQPLPAGAYDAEARTLTLDLQPGQHAITRPVATAAAGGLQVRIGGKASDLTQEVVPHYVDGAIVTGRFSAPEGLYTAKRGGAAGQVVLNGMPVESGAAIVWLRETNVVGARPTQAGDVALNFIPLEVDAQPRVATVLDELPEGAILIEAETFTETSGGTPSRYSHRTFLSGGVGVGEWTIPGMWLAWRLDAPAGKYHLVVKGSTHEPYADRVIVLDGEPLGGELLTYRFEHTGGFGAKPEEWRQMLVVGADGAPAVLDLTAGAHTLTMTCLANRLNLDFVALVPVE